MIGGVEVKVLIVMAGFFPGRKYGGPPVSVDNFCSLMDDYECYIVTRNHDMGEVTPYENIRTGEWLDRGNCKVLYLNDSDYCMSSFKNAIIEVEPDVIYLQGLFQRCVVPCLRLAKKYSINVLLAPRGELCAGAFQKRFKKIPYILLLRLRGWLENVAYQSTSDEETNALCRILKAPKDRVHYLSNIPSIPTEEYVPRTKEQRRASFVFVSRIVSKKNLVGAIRFFQSAKGCVQFDIYGPVEDEQYWEDCRRAIDDLPDNVTARYCGLISHDEVHRVLSRYDAFVFPTFSENFGHVIVESLNAGCPVIVSDQTPWNDIDENGAGWEIPIDQSNAFVEAIQRIIDSSEEEQSVRRTQSKKYIRSKLRLDVLKNEYDTAFRSLQR